jgi:ubiquitin-activating enzyme E1
MTVVGKRPSSDEPSAPLVTQDSSSKRQCSVSGGGGNLSGNGNASSIAPTLSNAAAGIAGMELDEDLHSRQIAVYGREGMKRMSGASILVSGANGLGVEIGERLLQVL